MAEPLAPLDLAFWNIETPGHPMHLGALGIFTADAPGAAARHATELLAARAAAVPGLRMRIRDRFLPPGSAVRAPDPAFDPLDHIRLAPPAADFQAAAGPLMAAPLSRQRPPWEAHVIPGEPGRGAFAVLFKFHHALADGMRALTLAATLLDPGAGRPDRCPGPPREQPRATAPEPLGGLAPGRLPEAVRGGLDAAGRAVAETAHLLDIGAAFARNTWGVRTSPAFTAAPGGGRLTAGVRLDLDDVHRVRKVTGGTVNDILIALVAGALRRWLDERGDDPTGLAPRALVPVSRRRPDTAHPQGNRLSSYLLRLPVGEGDPLVRLRSVRGAMDRNKAAGPHRGAGAVARFAELVPPLGHRLGGPLAAQAARLLYDILVTSVPLPSPGLRLGGCPLAEVFPLAPLARGQSLAVAVSTYRGAVHYGLLADAAAVPDLAALAAAVPRELTALQRATGGPR